MVDVEIIDAKNGQGSILVSADPEMCSCGPDGRKARICDLRFRLELPVPNLSRLCVLQILRQRQHNSAPCSAKALLTKC